MLDFVYVRPKAGQSKAFKRWFYERFNEGHVPPGYKGVWVKGSRWNKVHGYSTCPAITLDMEELNNLFNEIKQKSLISS